MDDEISQRLDQLERQQALAEQVHTEAFWTALDRAYDVSLKHRQLTCVVCAHKMLHGEWDTVTDQCMFGGGKLERYRCPNCDCIFGPQKFLDLSDAFVTLDYQLLYSRYSEGDSHAQEIRAFRSLDAAKNGIFLDWGCGGAWSRAVDCLRDEGYDVWGYEPSAPALGTYVVNRRDHIVTLFDGIFSNNVIEHFRDPVAEFRDLHSLLKPGARMAHASPCYEYNYGFTRFHSVFLLGRSPDVLAERSGFGVVGREQDGEYINLIYERR